MGLGEKVLKLMAVGALGFNLSIQDALAYGNAKTKDKKTISTKSNYDFERLEQEITELVQKYIPNIIDSKPEITPICINGKNYTRKTYLLEPLEENQKKVFIRVFIPKKEGDTYRLEFHSRGEGSTKGFGIEKTKQGIRIEIIKQTLPRDLKKVIYEKTDHRTIKIYEDNHKLIVPKNSKINIGVFNISERLRKNYK